MQGFWEGKCRHFRNVPFRNVPSRNVCLSPPRMHLQNVVELQICKKSDSGGAPLPSRHRHIASTARGSISTSILPPKWRRRAQTGYVVSRRLGLTSFKEHEIRKLLSAVLRFYYIYHLGIMTCISIDSEISISHSSSSSRGSDGGGSGGSHPFSPSATTEATARVRPHQHWL
ncbi:hypothetical protein Vafri_6184 [Volvox africanus]|uniref:Uncharacterized protein n=1 Tax=Volvox africanus TaxID=51714 RepID=A0A8J4AYJ8_9CHLO|nr:hypothetical protein Vafri_6184 [Volvox africanus]